MKSSQPSAQGISALAVKTWNENILFSALVELTYRCNLDCFFCYNDTSLRGARLSKKQYFTLFEDLADLQVLNLALSGGEPLAHPHFFDLGARARELGFVVRVKSNGHALRGELARRLRDEVDPYAVELSIHGASAAVHDRQTRVAGSFERLMSNIEEMRSLGLRLHLNCPLTAWNEHQIEEILELRDRWQLRMTIDAEIRPRDDGDKEPLEIAPSREGRDRFTRLLSERAARDDVADAPVSTGREADSEQVATASDKHCGAGASTIAVDPYGEVYPCVQWRWPIGSLHQTSIKEIWNGSPVLDDVRRVNRKVKSMIGDLGNQGSRFTFCPGAAGITTGSPIELHRPLATAENVAPALDGENKRDLLPIVG